MSVPCNNVYPFILFFLLPKIQAYLKWIQPCFTFSFYKGVGLLYHYTWLNAKSRFSLCLLKYVTGQRNLSFCGPSLHGQFCMVSSFLCKHRPPLLTLSCTSVVFSSETICQKPCKSTFHSRPLHLKETAYGDSVHYTQLLLLQGTHMNSYINLVMYATRL